jgi:hypothetical protein
MAIAHLCLECGWDLARIRAVCEPHYRIWLVRCPHCARACVRQRHPLWRGWRKFLRLKASLLAMLGQTFVLLILTAINLLALSFSHQLRGWSAADAWEEYRAQIILSFVVVPIVTGTWLTAGLRHCPRWKIWIGWTLFIALLLSVEYVMHGIGRAFNIPHYVSNNPRVVVRELIWNLGTLALMMTIALAGLPLGWKLLQSFSGNQRHYWRKRRIKRRMLRNFG